MVIMESCCLPENSFNELWQEIDRCHLSYLMLEESPEKIDQRNRLEEYIHDFLCVSGHYHKFTFHETQEVLQLSATYKKDFSAYKAIMGFNAIQMYAGNLLSQPWRKEYKTIKTYCGFYKHQVEANLIGAEKLFEAMGYRYYGEGLLVLEDPICPDRVTAVSRDCLIAYVECQILKAIWEEVCTSFKISWQEVLDFRTSHICSPKQCIIALKSRHHQRQYQEHSRSLSQGSNPFQSVHCQTISVPVVSPMVPMNHSFPPSSSHHHHVGLPVQPEYMNGCCPANYSGYTIPYTQAVMRQQDFVYNIPVTANNIYPVPTAKLIEVEPNHAFDVVDHPSVRNRPLKKLAENEYNNTMKNGVDPKDSQLEEWDYVYRNLENQGYTKDLGERGDILSPNTIKQLKEVKKVKQTNLDEAFNHLNIYDRPLKVSDVPKKAQRIPNDVAKEAKTKILAKEKLSAIDKSVQAKTVEKKIKEDKPIKKKILNKQQTESTDPSNRWQCRHCTYLNDNVKDICEICGKSKIVKDEAPIEVGGAECSQCTLVNSKSNKVCEACGTSLVGSPTYI